MSIPEYITEEWLPIPGYKNYYEVSNRGRVRRVGGDVLKQFHNNLKSKYTTYMCVSLSCKGIVKSFEVHRLVAMTFFIRPPGDVEVNHIDGDGMNNRVENLEYVTHAKNCRHAVDVLGRKYGRGAAGEKHPMSKLTNEQALEIKVSDAVESELAIRFGVSRRTIKSIRSGRSWKCLSR